MRKTILMGAAAFVALLSVPAAAQFTAVVAPPKPKIDPAVASAVPAAVARRDSVARVTMTNMKDWVDSAAAAMGASVAPVVGDTLSRSPTGTPPLATPARPDTAISIPMARATTEFREGAPAPNTATPLPLIALLGAIALTSGLWLFRAPKRA